MCPIICTASAGYPHEQEAKQAKQRVDAEAREREAAAAALYEGIPGPDAPWEEVQPFITAAGEMFKRDACGVTGLKDGSVISAPRAQAISQRAKAWQGSIASSRRGQIASFLLDLQLALS